MLHTCAVKAGMTKIGICVSLNRVIGYNVICPILFLFPVAILACAVRAVVIRLVMGFIYGKDSGPKQSYTHTMLPSCRASVLKRTTPTAVILAVPIAPY